MSHSLTGSFRWEASRGSNSLGSFEVSDLSKLTDEQVQWLVTRGITESIRNSWASIKSDDPKAVELSLKAGLDWIERLERGEVIEGGRGGPRLTPFMRALREVVAHWLVNKKGLKASDAEKAARDPHAIVKEYARLASDAGKGDLGELYERTMATFTTAAQAIVDRQSTSDVEV